MALRLFAIVCLCAAGCSKARPPGGGPDADDGDQPDARENPDAADEPDAAPHIDAAPGTPDATPGTPDAPPPPPDATPPPPDAHVPVAITLTDNIDSTTITALNSVSCNDGVSDRENSYYRTFTLADFGVVGPLTITTVTFAVENATGGITTTQPATLKLYTYGGAVGGTTLDTAQMSLITSLNVNVSDTTTGSILSFPMTASIPANSTFVVELLTPDSAATGDLIFIGSNAGGQTQPSYLRAPDCGASLPTSVASLGFPNMHQIITVTGSYTP